MKKKNQKTRFDLLISYLLFSSYFEKNLYNKFIDNNRTISLFYLNIMRLY